VIRPEWQEHIRQMVDGWPPVEPETYAELALLLAPERLAVAETAATSQPLPQVA
jgi:hypothetical protein